MKKDTFSINSHYRKKELIEDLKGGIDKRKRIKGTRIVENRKREEWDRIE